MSRTINYGPRQPKRPNRRRRKTSAKEIGGGVLLGIGIVAAFVLLVAFLYALGVAITSVFVWLIWNVLGLHALLGLPALAFWEVVAVAAVINLVRSIFWRPETKTVVNNQQKRYR